MKLKSQKHSLASVTIVLVSIVLFVVCMNVCSYSELVYSAGDSSKVSESENKDERSDTTNNGDTFIGDAGDSQVDYSDPDHPVTYDENGNLMAANEVILTLDKGVDESEFATSLEYLGYSLKETLVESDDSYGATVTIGLPTGISVEDALATLEKQDEVDCVDPNYVSTISSEDSSETIDFAAVAAEVFESKHQTEDNSQASSNQLAATSTSQHQDDEATTASTSVNDSKTDYQWALDAMNVYSAWDYSKTNKTVSVAVLDSGINVDHEDLVDNIVATYNAETDTDFSVGDNEHGTHVSGIVAARANNSKGIAGVSYNAGIVAIDVSYTNSSGEKRIYDSAIIDAYSYIIKNASTYNIRVANMSFGREGGLTNTFERLFNKAKDAGIISIAAAGNDADELGSYEHHPSDYDACVSVINLTGKQTGTKGGDIWSWITGDYDVILHGSPYTRSSGSNYGPEKDISAPGTDIYSSTVGSSYESFSGTSMASPQVAGVAALIFAANSSLTVNQCKDILYSTATDLGTTGRDNEYGWGMVNVEAAVKKAKAGGETHSWSSSTVIQKQSCTTDKIVRYTCKYCEETKDVVEATKTGHNYVDTVTQKQSCTNPEITTYRCSNCGDSYTLQTKNALGHSYTSKITKEPTCTDTGIRTYTCSNCGNTYTETINSLGGHKYVGSITKEATCETKGTTTYTCSVCSDSYSLENIDALGHTYASEITSQPTCTDTGTKTYTCSRTGCSKSYTETLAAKGHTWQETITKQATCEDNGSCHHECLTCHESYDEVILAIGHNYQYVTTKEPTCAEAGEMNYQCINCGIIYATYSITPTEHTYISEVIQKLSCTEDEITRYTCEVCGHTYDDVVSAKGHTWSDGVVILEPTCKSAGTKRYTCTVCGDTKDEKIKATGQHKYEGIVTKDANCVEAGVKTYTCSVCGDAYEEAIEPTGHLYSSSITKEATCKEAGVKTYTCSNCGDSYIETIPISQTHKIVRTTTPATCEQPGNRHGECSVCGEVIYDQTIAAKGHAYTSKITKKATCLEDGVTTYTCSNCGDTYTEPIASAGAHSYVVVDSVAATCDKDGYTRYKCSECGETYEDVVKATGEHKYESAVTKEPTCVEAGETTYTCSVCGASYTEPISALGHKYELQTKEATCVDDGYKKSVCTVCGYVEKEETIPALGHSYELVDSKDATCVADGYKNYRCANCGDTYSDVTKATGHKFGEPIVTKEPSCTEAGERTYTCSVCSGTKTETIAATGHTDNWTVVQEPKLGYVGKEENHCKTCNEYLGSRDIDSLATWNRLAGDGRYDTAAEIASEYIGDKTCDYVIIASGENFPDALASSYASGMLDAPIILTSSGSLSPQSRNQIQNSGATKAIIIGGDGAISSEVKSQIEDIDNIKEVTRIAGNTRISTAEDQLYKVKRFLKKFF